jgi:hypothetical protein
MIEAPETNNVLYAAQGYSPEFLPDLGGVEDFRVCSSKSSASGGSPLRQISRFSASSNGTNEQTPKGTKPNGTNEDKEVSPIRVLDAGKAPVIRAVPRTVSDTALLAVNERAEKCQLSLGSSPLMARRKQMKQAHSKSPRANGVDAVAAAAALKAWAEIEGDDEMPAVPSERATADEDCIGWHSRCSKTF